MVFVTIDAHSRHDAGICGALLTKAHERGERRDLSACARAWSSSRTRSMWWPTWLSSDSWQRDNDPVARACCRYRHQCIRIRKRMGVGQPCAGPFRASTPTRSASRMSASSAEYFSKAPWSRTCRDAATTLGRWSQPGSATGCRSSRGRRWHLAMHRPSPRGAREGGSGRAASVSRITPRSPESQSSYERGFEGASRLRCPGDPQLAPTRAYGLPFSPRP